MIRRLGLVLVVSAMIPPAFSQAKAPPPAFGFASEAETVSAIQAYLDRMGMPFEVDREKEFPVISFSKTMDHATHRVRIIVDRKRELVYIFLNRYLSLPLHHPRRDAVLRELMKQNWALNIGKFEWDESDGEVRFSYSFSTENGIGYEAFEAVVLTLLRTGDKLWPELGALTGRSGS